VNDKKINKYMALTALVFILSGLGQAITVSVTPEKSIQEAIDKSQQGDIIEIQSGTYFENVFVMKPLVIRGVDTGKGFPTVNAQGRGSTITLSANRTTLECLNFTGAGGWEEAGIKVISNGCVITNCIASNNYGIGIYLLKANDNHLINNDVFNNNFGVALNTSSNNTLKDNRMYSNKNNFLSASIYSGNNLNDIDTSNKIDGKPLYYLVNKTNFVIDSSSNAGNVYCIRCQNITIRDLIIDHSFAGIYLHDTTNSHIMNNTIRNNSMGISLIDSSNNDIRKNLVSDNSYGIFLKTASADNTITENNVSKNDYGIFLDIDGKGVQSNIIYNNILIDNTKGNAYSRGSAEWDNGSKGNLYSDYDQPGEGCTDSDGNGICDRPYRIRGGPGLDENPLTKPS
jgi:parallel beta-helix repeat protein